MNPVNRLDEAEKQICLAIQELDLEGQERTNMMIARQVVANTRDEHMPEYEEPDNE